MVGQVKFILYVQFILGLGSMELKHFTFSMGFVSGFLGFLLCIWDFVTYPVYFMIDQPWRVTRYVV